MKKILIHLSIYIFICVNFALAQDEKKACGEVSNKKAEKLLDKGRDKKNTVEERIEYLKQAMEMEPEYAEALNELIINQMKVYKVKGTSFKPIEENCKRLDEICPGYYPYSYYYLGEYYYGKEQYAEAVTYLKKFLKNADNVKSDKDYSNAEDMLDDAIFYDKMMNHPVPFDPKVVNGVSSKTNEYLAIISPDNETCLYTRTVEEVVKDRAWASDKQREVFMYSKRADVNTDFDNGTQFNFPFNEGSDAYGGACLSLDNKTMYITICKPGKGGYMNCDIYSAVYRDEVWEQLKNLGPNINTEDGWESQPTISADGKTLIFATARADSKKIDLFYSTKGADGEWSKAQSLGPAINTGGSEKTPFLHSDSQTLYFSSDGQRGVGGFDIFYSRMNDKGEWQKPQNIGFPINSEDDEYGFFVSLDGHLGYFASNKFAKIGKGGIDVLSFPIPQEAKPEKVLFMKGEVKNELGEIPAFGKVEIKDLKTNEVKTFDVDQRDGKYAAVVTLKKDRDFVMTVKKEEGIPEVKHISPKDSVKAGKPIKENITVENIIVGKTYELSHINYHTNSADLTEESKLILDNMVDFMKENPTLKIAIQGHTDDVGKDDLNLALSTDRAFSVTAYLHEKGIDKERLSFKGFGETKPLVPNDSDAHRAQNRRTEFVILSK